jgi:dCMP deaminase
MDRVPAIDKKAFLRHDAYRGDRFEICPLVEFGSDGFDESRHVAHSFIRREGEESMRLSWDDYFLKMAETACLRSTCLRAQFGAVLVRNHTIISTGYNGAAAGVRSCLERGECVRDRLQIPSGDLMDDATLYIYGLQQQKPRSGMPCFMCWRMIFNAGIGQVVFLDDEGKKIMVNVKVVDRGRILSYVEPEP